jgi:hypothetical protein
VDPCVVAHCQVQIYEVTLFYFICLCNLLNIGLCRSTIAHKG